MSMIKNVHDMEWTTIGDCNDPNYDDEQVAFNEALRFKTKVDISLYEEALSQLQTECDQLQQDRKELSKQYYEARDGFCDEIWSFLRANFDDTQEDLRIQEETQLMQLIGTMEAELKSIREELDAKTNEKDELEQKIQKILAGTRAANLDYSIRKLDEQKNKVLQDIELIEGLLRKENKIRHHRDVKEKRNGMNSENIPKPHKHSILYCSTDRKRPHNDVKFLPEKNQNQNPKKVRFNLSDNEIMFVDQLSQTSVFFRDLSS
ncbi:uncharacterized protein LOC141853506 [Brevipalpus obovatus]|uniref:uncharacterized protein LOC141853506 n=1 Tax=Brevipalpus obovatus TaxID=246614 RepID=UPI003D9E166E